MSCVQRNFTKIQIALPPKMVTSSVGQAKPWIFPAPQVLSKINTIGANNTWTADSGTAFAWSTFTKSSLGDMHAKDYESNFFFRFSSKCINHAANHWTSNRHDCFDKLSLSGTFLSNFIIFSYNLFFRDHSIYLRDVFLMRTLAVQQTNR